MFLENPNSSVPLSERTLMILEVIKSSVNNLANNIGAVEGALDKIKEKTDEIKRIQEIKKPKFPIRSFSKLACNYESNISNEVACTSNSINQAMKIEDSTNDFNNSIYVLNESQDNKPVIDLLSDNENESFSSPTVVHCPQEKKRKRYSLTQVKHEERKTQGM